MPSGGASLLSDQQHLVSGAARNLCLCATYMRKHRFTVCGGGWGVDEETTGTLNFSASHFLKDITFYNRDCSVLDIVIFLLSLYTVPV